MTSISVALRRRVLARSKDRCEYCQLAQAGQEATFHIDHVVPVASGGETVFDNLALACVSCSLKKGAKKFATDPETGDLVQLFNPRKNRWDDHFEWNEFRIIGLTSIGRATVVALDMNRPLILAIRAEEKRLGRHPYNP
ncbi:MAG: HNH endonuclease [Fimbriimonadia bacterium]|nr:HNH endonuclease [Fimbriimonadia bacterium]